MKNIMLKNGAITFLVLFGFGMLTQLLSNGGTSMGIGVMGFLVNIVVLYVGIHMGHTQFKQSGDGNMDFVEGFKLGLGIVLIASILLALSNYIMMMLMPELLDQMKQMQLEQFQKGDYPDEVIDQTVEAMDKFFTPGWISIMSLMFYLFLGAIIAIVASSINKQEKYLV